MKEINEKHDEEFSRKYKIHYTWNFTFYALSPESQYEVSNLEIFTKGPKMSEEKGYHNYNFFYKKEVLGIRW